ncbi:MAG TPA: hypothetical protein VFW33_12340, partial [Gemmataceae bacterium]|nr:hypothetical protein [Gemmataceae bacterium]
MARVVVNRTRLAIVVGGAMLYLLGGAGLAVYCFHAGTTAPPPADTAPADRDGPPPAAPPAPPPVASDPAGAEEDRKTNKAIADGAWYLKQHVLPSDTWGDNVPSINVGGLEVGFASLPGLTLLECGVPGDDLVLRGAANYVRAHAPQLGGGYDTYQRSLAVLFLDRLGDRGDEELIQYLALCLIAGQHPTDGAWNYSVPSPDRARTARLVKLLADDKTSLDDWRKEALKGETFEVPRWDNSNTQFAVLALWAAGRHGVRIDRSIALVKQHFIETQLAAGADANNLNQDGSWPYSGPDKGGNPWPAMTCSGLLGLAVAHGLADAAKGDPRDDPPIRRGLAMLGREINRDGDTRALDLYYLWSVERVGVLFNLNKIGEQDWYAWGRKLLLEKQKPDGSWNESTFYGGNPPVVD